MITFIKSLFHRKQNADQLLRYEFFMTFSNQRLKEFQAQTGCTIIDDHAKTLWKVKYGEDFPIGGNRS